MISIPPIVVRIITDQKVSILFSYPPLLLLFPPLPSLSSVTSLSVAHS